MTNWKCASRSRFGHAVWYTNSFGDLTAMKQAFMRAAELADRAGNTEIRLKALWGTWAAVVNRRAVSPSLAWVGSGFLPSAGVTRPQR